MTWKCGLELCWRLSSGNLWVACMVRGVHGRWLCCCRSAPCTQVLVGRQVPVTVEDTTLEPLRALGKIGFSPGSAPASVQVKATCLQSQIPFSISGVCIPEQRRQNQNHLCAWMACLIASVHTNMKIPLLCVWVVEFFWAWSNVTCSQGKRKLLRSNNTFLCPSPKWLIALLGTKFLHCLLF